MTFHAGKRKKEWAYALETESDCLTNLRFADDVLLFATSCEQLHKMMCEFKQSTEKVELKIHPGKTKVLSNQSSSRRKEMEVDNIKVELLTKDDCTKYLGHLHFSNRRQLRSTIEPGLLGRRFTNTSKG